MDFKDLVTLYFDRGNAVQTFWNFQVTIILALLAFFGSIRSSRRKHLLLAVILSFAYVAFAYVNIAAIKDVTNARNITKQLIQNWKPQENDRQVIQQLQLTVDPPTVLEVEAMHITGDVVALAGIWFLTLYGGPKPND